MKWPRWLTWILAGLAGLVAIIAIRPKLQSRKEYLDEAIKIEEGLIEEARVRSVEAADAAAAKRHIEKMNEHIGRANALEDERAYVESMVDNPHLGDAERARRVSVEWARRQSRLGEV